MAEILAPHGVLTSGYWSGHKQEDDSGHRLIPLPEDPDLKNSVKALLQEYVKNPNANPIKLIDGFIISQRSLNTGTIVRLSYERLKLRGKPIEKDGWRDYYQAFTLWGVSCNFLDEARNEEILLCFHDFVNNSLDAGPTIQLPITIGKAYHEGFADSQFLFKVNSMELHRRV